MIKKLIISAFVLFLPLFILGCDDNNNNFNSGALTEDNFANNGSLRAVPDGGVIVDFLESPESNDLEGDTGKVGIDEIPVRYSETVEQTFCWEDEDIDAMHFMELIDINGSEVLQVDVNGDCVTEIIERGNYVITIHHDGMTDITFPVFIIPNSDAVAQTINNTGLIDRIKASVLQGVSSIIYKDAWAQTVEENIETLIKTRACPGCDLNGANLSEKFLAEINLAGADLSNADLRGSFLDKADLSDAKLIRANLEFVRLDTVLLLGADLSMAKLHLASLRGMDLDLVNFTKADLSDSFLTGANLELAILVGANVFGADLRNVNASGANLTDANFRLTNFTGANLIGTDFSGSNLTGARWCDGICGCDPNSFGMCSGCPPQDTCTGS